MTGVFGYHTDAFFSCVGPKCPLAALNAYVPIPTYKKSNCTYDRAIAARLCTRVAPRRRVPTRVSAQVLNPDNERIKDLFQYPSGLAAARRYAGAKPARFFAIFVSRNHN